MMEISPTLMTAADVLNVDWPNLWAPNRREVEVGQRLSCSAKHPTEITIL